jgi:hypothetical protein
LPTRSAAELEVERRDFEALIKELLVATTDEWAEHRFQILKGLSDAQLARALADKAKLSEIEKKYFSKIIVRLYDKYVGLGFYTDEMMGAVLVCQYILRNLEPMRVCLEIKNGNAKQPPIQRTTNPDPGHDRPGQNNGGLKVDTSAARISGANL